MKNEFDNNLTDRGWRSMRRLLDREMPEQRRRRRFAWWPLALFLLPPLAGAGGWWLYTQIKPATESPVLVPAPAEKMQHTGKPVAEMETTSPVDGEKPQSPHKLTNTVGSSNLPAIQAGPARDNSGQMTSGRQTAAPQSGPTTQSRLTDDKNLHTKYLTTQDVKDEAFATDGPPSSDAFTVDKPLGNLTDFEVLNTLPVVLQLVDEQSKNTLNPTPVAAFQPEIIKKQSVSNQWSFGLAAGLATEQFASLNGFSGGAAVNWQFHRKWGLRSGVQYAQYRLPADERLVVALDALEYADATGNIVNLNTGNPGTPSPSVSSPEVLVPVERLRQLEMPLLAYWQPLRPLRIFAGISTTYTLSAEASNKSYANNQTYLTADKSAQENLDDLTSSTLSRWQTHLQAGAGVRIGRHFELDAFYRHGFPQTAADQSTLDQNGQFNPSSSQSVGNTGASHYFLFNGIWFF